MNWLKIITNFLFGIILVIAGYLLIAIMLSLMPTHPPDLNCHRNGKVFVSTNGVHLDIILPVDALNSKLTQQLKLSPSIQYVAFGWGDKQFYLKTPRWSDLTVAVAVKALFIQSESAMHVTRYSTSFRSWVPLEICQDQLQELNSFISDSFEVNDAGNFITLNAEGYGSNDTFYDARGSFSMFLTCNVWVNKALKEMDVKTAVWSPFDFGVLHHLR